MTEAMFEKLLKERDEAIEKVKKLEARWEVLKEKVSGEISASHEGSWTAYNIKQRMRELEEDERY